MTSSMLGTWIWWNTYKDGEMYDLAIVKSLTNLFKNYISHSIFPENCKKSNICSIHKKGDIHTVINYRPVSL